MNRQDRRKATRRNRGMLVTASLAAGSLFGYVGYTRPAFAVGNPTCEVTSNSSNPNDTTPGTLAFCIDDLVSDGTGVITFASNVTQIDMSANSPFVIDKSLTIQGSSTVTSVSPVFDGGKTGTPGSYSGSQIFDSTAGTLTLREIGLTNGYISPTTSDDVGGAVRKLVNDGDLILDSVMVSGNTSSKGGAIHANADIYVLSTGDFQSNFEDNKAFSSSGGAIFGDRSVDITDATFKNNYSALDGGAVYADRNSSVTLSDFSQNDALRNGGAVFGDGDLSVSDSRFVSNRADKDGGALFIDSNADVSNSSFSMNSAVRNGGAVDINGSEGSNQSFVSNVFSENSGDKGGAIYTFYYSLSINKNSFYANSADKGGGVYFYNSRNYGELRVNNSTFYKNVADEGSAVFSREDNGTFVNFSTVYKNYDLGSVGHPAIFINSTLDSSSRIDNSIIASNSRDEDKSAFDDLTAGLSIDQYTFTSADMPIGLNPVVIDDVFQFLAPDPSSDAVGAADFTLTFPQGGLTSSDQVGNVRVEGEANVGAINTTQEAIVESSPPSFSAPVPTTSPILNLEENRPFSQGETVVARVSNATRVESVSIGDTEAEIISFEDGLLSFTVPELEAGSYSITGLFNSGTVIFDVGLEITGQSVSEAQALNVWTKKVSDTEVKVYAKNPIGNGKIQFFVDDEEIAWVRAEDSDDPKLSETQGAFYLVRTVELTDSKQAIEIFVDGVRAWRAAYTATS